MLDLGLVLPLLVTYWSLDLYAGPYGIQRLDSNREFYELYSQGIYRPDLSTDSLLDRLIVWTLNTGLLTR